jgi:probable rRNA maturation factor
VSLLISLDDGYSISKSLKKRLEELITLIFSEEKIDEGVINLRILGDQEMQKLNLQFRNKDKTTNVLSFTNDDISLAHTKNIGDIAISMDYVINEAKEEGKDFDSHMIHMLAHGIYHVLGHDHVNELMADSMEAKEIEILSKLNIKNPYH